MSRDQCPRCKRHSVFHQAACSWAPLSALKDHIQILCCPFGHGMPPEVQLLGDAANLIFSASKPYQCRGHSIFRL